MFVVLLIRNSQKKYNLVSIDAMVKNVLIGGHNSRMVGRCVFTRMEECSLLITVSNCLYSDDL